MGRKNRYRLPDARIRATVTRDVATGAIGTIIPSVGNDCAGANDSDGCRRPYRIRSRGYARFDAIEAMATWERTMQSPATPRKGSGECSKYKKRVASFQNPFELAHRRLIVGGGPPVPGPPVVTGALEEPEQPVEAIASEKARNK